MSKHIAMALRRGANVWRYRNKLPEVNYPAINSTFPDSCSLCGDGKISDRLDYIVDAEENIKAFCSMCGREHQTAIKAAEILKSYDFKEINEQWEKESKQSRTYLMVKEQEAMAKASFRVHKRGPTSTESINSEDEKPPPILFVRGDPARAATQAVPVEVRAVDASPGGGEIPVPRRTLTAEEASRLAAEIASQLPKGGPPVSEEEFQKASQPPEQPVKRGPGRPRNPPKEKQAEETSPAE